MDPLFVVTFLAGLVELVIEALKPLLEPAVSKFTWKPYLYISLATGLALALIYGANVLALVGLPAETTAQQAAGTIVTGLLVGRGANFVHDLIALAGGK